MKGLTKTNTPLYTRSQVACTSDDVLVMASKVIHRPNPTHIFLKIYQ